MKDFESNLNQIRADIKTYYGGCITTLEYAEAAIYSNEYHFFNSDNFEELNKEFLEYVKANTDRKQRELK